MDDCTPSSPPAQTDVLIVGAGMAGCALAASLAPTGMNIVLLEANALPRTLPSLAQGVTTVDPRVSAISLASMRLLERVGAWKHIPAAALGGYSSMAVWEEDGTANINFDAGDVNQNVLGHIVENRWIVGSLLAALARFPNVSICAGQCVTGAERREGSIRLQLESGPCVDASLVVGADGARSRLRTLFSITAREWDCEQQAIVATVRTGASHRHTAWQCFMQSGPLALLPLADPHMSSIVWSADTAVAAQLLELDDAAFAARLERASESRLGAVVEVSPRQAFPLRQVHAGSYVAPQLALVADAAHVIHPLAGQGINLGFADVRVLGEEIERAIGRGLPPGDAGALGRYQRRRRPENEAMLRAMTSFRRLYGESHPAIRLLRNLGLQTVNRYAPLKHWFMRQAMGS